MDNNLYNVFTHLYSISHLSCCQQYCLHCLL
ncbi:DUF5522 domain-containing protein [uncultured Prevotella sp.]